MNTYLGASAELGADDVDADLIAARARSRTSRATSGTSPTAKDAYRLAARAAHDAGNRVALTLSDPLLRRPPPRRVPRAGRGTRSTCCSPTRPRSRRCTRSTTSTTRSQQVPRHCEIAALTRGEQGAVIVARRRGRTWSTPHPGRRARRHHRRRRPLRGRVPLRAHARLRPRHRAAGSARSPRPRSSATSAPARQTSLAELAATAARP